VRSPASPPIYEFGEFRLDPSQHTLVQISDNRPVQLTPRTYETLLYLVENQGQLVEKASLMKAIWPGMVVEENNLNQQISAIRRALNDGNERPRYILTVPRRGYRFIADVQVAAPAANASGTTWQVHCKDPHAYGLYLQASSLMLWPEAANLEKAIALLDDAVRRDREFAQAHALQAMAHAVSYHEKHFGGEALDRADRAAALALGLQPANGMALGTLAATRAIRLAWLDSEAYFQKALASEANEAFIHRARAAMYFAVGYSNRALQHARRAYELAPANCFNVLGMAFAMTNLARDEEVRKYSELAISLGAARHEASLCYVLWDLARRARDLEQSVRSLSPLLPTTESITGSALLEQLHRAMFDTRERASGIAALRSLDGLVHDADAIDHLLVAKLIAAIQLDQMDLAYQIVDRALIALKNKHAPYRSIAIWHPDMGAFRRDPRFQGVVERLGLLGYWKAHGPPDHCELRGQRLIFR
jgi:DNA-binding winged helix-turn-helix (wHTH) protein